MQKLIASFLIIIAACTANAAGAASQDKQFLQSIAGQWNGSGEVVAGKYKGAKFNCAFSSISEIAGTGMTLDGNCRLGMFSQPIKARFIRNATGYHGTFNNGSRAQGLDIVSGKIKKNYMIFELNREQFNGSMQARLADSNSMNIILAIKAEEIIIPVIGLKLVRASSAPVSNLAKN